MAKYITKRILMSVVTLFIIIFTLFVLVRIMPGDPFPVERMTAEMIELKRIELGLDRPIPIQFADYMARLLQGDLGNGTSLYNGAPIMPIILVCMENSFKIGVMSILFGSGVGLMMGIAAALNRGKFIDRFCTICSILGVCVPSYVFMIFLQYFFAYKIPFFPYFFDPSNFFFSAIMPAVSLSLISIATVARFTRNEMLEVLDSDYVKLAKSRGLYGFKLIRKHVLRNALIPVVTVIAPLVVDLLTGAMVMEKIYGVNGLGKLMVDAIAGEGIDYNYVLALSILFSSLYIGIMLILDILYVIIDPRIRLTAKEKV
ncbi:MAG: ABC transporter permease [Selenomonadaceae bacterium]|nr:ABC transporter permease [Selenomonadaceae bacterium]MBR3722902.1 ABC transporter permease [Selenomonadaceae bacterium]